LLLFNDLFDGPASLFPIPSASRSAALTRAYALDPSLRSHNFFHSHQRELVLLFSTS